MINKRIPFLVCLTLFLGQSLAGALIFEKSEYAARRTKLMDRIPGGIAVILGAQPVTGFNPYVQNNDVMYFCGVEIPNSILVIDAVNRESVLFFTTEDYKTTDTFFYQLKYFFLVRFYMNLCSIQSADDKLVQFLF